MDKTLPYASFLGPASENEAVFERLLLEYLRDHIYWRRNFHPEDPPAIPPFADQTGDYRRFVADMRRELHALSAALKRSVPFSSPRYIGHMASDLLLPGLIAQMITLPYNPNNVTGEAAPVTLDMEIGVGLQLARLFGFPDDETRPDCAFGHLTSGGTMANYEALWLLRAAKCLAPAWRDAARAAGYRFVQPRVRKLPLDALDDWTAFNLAPDETVALHQACLRELQASGDTALMARLLKALDAHRVETLGLSEFMRRYPGMAAPRLLVPLTAHYSWPKAMKLLGLGSAQIVSIGERGMRLDAGHMAEALETAARERAPVLGAVGVTGTTEFGTIDPIHEMAELRDARQQVGQGFGLHVDAAWGGYLATLFREPDGSLRPHEAVRAEFRYFPSREVYAAFAALARADTITVDPHKLGYLPYGAGALVCRDNRLLRLNSQEAAYVFTPESAREDYRARFRQLGRYILEGSKPGAAAAAAYVTHRTLPLDHAHFGRLTRATIRASEYFYDRVTRLAEEVRDVARVSIPFEPDTNLVCLAVNPAGNRSLARMNRFIERLYEHLKVDPAQPVQLREFYGSFTSVRRAALGEDECRRVLAELGLAPDSLRDAAAADPQAADRMHLLRHTLMNPWLDDRVNGINYTDLYCRYLARLIRAES